ncbi:hypothetical protein WSM22_43580 [Cytophagales bacterium WSM2-2]|nr:hypothetical protein WSM22_43580 [Cytophagales bacterium WSM2-2]
MIIVSCSAKLHAFNLAEQLERHQLLRALYTVYHQKKNSVFAKLNSRKDLEQISLSKINTLPVLAPLVKSGVSPFKVNSIFDNWVSGKITKDCAYRAFIGWSGMSLRSIKQVKAAGKKVVIERGSSHIGFQIPLLEEEYSAWGFHFQRDNRIIDQELEEYELADYISIPSEFVGRTFVEKGIDQNKLIKNNYGSSSYFRKTKPRRSKFTVLYVGKLSLRKGLPYFFQALNTLDLNTELYDVWFIGSIEKEVQELIPRFNKPNWKFFGHVGHYQLPDLISQCSVAVHPSLEEGLSMVIPQIMSCGVPVIATTNTGGTDIIEDQKSGFIVPIRSPREIAEKLTLLFSDKVLLERIQESAEIYAQQFGSWQNYGDRYAEFLKKII